MESWMVLSWSWIESLDLPILLSNPYAKEVYEREHFDEVLQFDDMTLWLFYWALQILYVF